MADWQPIETAPNKKDVLLYRCGYPLCIAGRFFNGEEWGWATIERPDDWIEGEPTHWQPLPEPPEAAHG